MGMVISIWSLIWLSNHIVFFEKLSFLFSEKLPKEVQITLKIVVSRQFLCLTLEIKWRL